MAKVVEEIKVAPLNTCLFPTSLLDDDCYACRYVFTCTVTRASEKKEVIPMLLTMEGEHQCVFCREQKDVLQVHHRSIWFVCKECLTKHTDFGVSVEGCPNSALTEL